MVISILDRTDAVIDRWLRLDRLNRPLQYKHKSALLYLVKHPPESLDGLRLVQELSETITENWHTFRCQGSYPSARRSKKNWRFQKQPRIAPGNTSPEKTLEKTIVSITGEDWINQVPTCSGLVGSRERARNVDLVYRYPDGKGYSFIELKVHSNHPLFAAMEILKYGVVYYFWRKHLQELHDLGFPTEDRELLKAEGVDLQVLAPWDYYAGGNLDWLEAAIDDGLKRFHESSRLGFKVSFQFRAFPSGFSWPSETSNLLDALQGRRSVNE